MVGGSKKFWKKFLGEKSGSLKFWKEKRENLF
jgi:hypothetical protein